MAGRTKANCEATAQYVEFDRCIPAYAKKEQNVKIKNNDNLAYFFFQLQKKPLDKKSCVILVNTKKV